MPDTLRRLGNWLNDWRRTARVIGDRSLFQQLRTDHALRSGAEGRIEAVVAKANRQLAHVAELAENVERCKRRMEESSDTHATSEYWAWCAAQDALAAAWMRDEELLGETGAYPAALRLAMAAEAAWRGLDA